VEYQPDPKNIHGAGGPISRVEPGSIAADLGLQPGDSVLAVGDLVLRDVIDYRFAIAEEHISLLVRHADGREVRYALDKDPDDDLGIDFSEPLFDRLRTCNNKCPFCFLTQMPKGMRKTLYLKDDDYRLSFLYGNFVTLTNLTEADWQRIETQRLSPLHISVHATDRALRAVLLGKRDVDDVLAQLARLAAARIEVHTQVVACPELNDGSALHRTVQELAAWYPTVQSISVVPVGLTRFRFTGKAPQSVRAAIQVHETPDWIDTNWQRQPLWEGTQSSAPAGTQTHGAHGAQGANLLNPADIPNLPDSAAEWGYCSRLAAASDIPLRCYTPAEAERLIDDLLPYGAYYQRELGLGLVYPSDEFYLLCGRTLPPAAFYDDYPQYSNGVGMTREFLDEWAEAAHLLPRKLIQPSRIALVCGTLIAPIMETVVARLNQIEGLTMRLLPVVNQFFGETVTVSGLLMGQDIVPALRESGCERAFLPRVMFDHQGMRTLDDYSPQRIATESGVAVDVVDDAAALARTVAALGRSSRAQRRAAARQRRQAAALAYERYHWEG
jgi:NifB/MoaA-like Fe-S oxidoreductase